MIKVNKEKKIKEFSKRSVLDADLISMGHDPKNFVFAHELSID